MNTSQIIDSLLISRGLNSEQEISEFLSPTHPHQITWGDLNIQESDVSQAIKIVQRHLNRDNKIAIYGDYDVDGLCSTAILWQTLYSHYKHVFPHIPDRRSEGYGLSQKGIDHCVSQGAKLIICVDSGIVAHDQISYAKDQGVDVIVIDHHEKADSLPPADAFIHSTATCAAGLSYFFTRSLINALEWTLNADNLDLASLAVICDLVPLIGVNRSLAKFGLEALNHTARPGLLALKEVAAIKDKITAYHVGFMLGPRLNATGRLTHALESLRLLCTNDSIRALELAKALNETNQHRQQLTESLTNHAISSQESLSIPKNSIIIAAHSSYDEGVIGLIAAKLVEKYFRPAIAISIGEDISKASARSIPGFHITDSLRKFSDQFLGVGGHSMAAGFSLKTSNLASCITRLESIEISADILIKKTRFDLDLPLELVSWELYLALKSLEPFGLGNPTPVFRLQNAQILDIKTIGKSGNHLKFTVTQNGLSYPAVWFNSPTQKIKEDIGESYDIFYQLDYDSYRGPGNLQLIIKNLVGIT